jgi:hypothetical protein
MFTRGYIKIITPNKQRMIWCFIYPKKRLAHVLWVDFWVRFLLEPVGLTIVWVVCWDIGDGLVLFAMYIHIHIYYTYCTYYRSYIYIYTLHINTYYSIYILHNIYIYYNMYILHIFIILLFMYFVHVINTHIYICVYMYMCMCVCMFFLLI